MNKNIRYKWTLVLWRYHHDCIVKAALKRQAEEIDQGKRLCLPTHKQLIEDWPDEWLAFS